MWHLITECKLQILPTLTTWLDKWWNVSLWCPFLISNHLPCLATSFKPKRMNDRASSGWQEVRIMMLPCKESLLFPGWRYVSIYSSFTVELLCATDSRCVWFTKKETYSQNTICYNSHLTKSQVAFLNNLLEYAWVFFLLPSTTYA